MALEKVKEIRGEAQENPEYVGFSIIALIVCFVWFLFAGFGFFVSLALCALLVIIFISPTSGIFVGSFITAATLKIFATSLSQVLSIWFAGPRLSQTFGWMQQTELWHLTWCIFIPLIAIYLIARSVRSFR